MGKSTISMAMFNSKLLVITRGYVFHMASSLANFGCKPWTEDFTNHPAAWWLSHPKSMTAIVWDRWSSLIVTREKHVATCWNKATGWFGALVRVTNFKFWFLRLRDKMLVFARVVKKCLQHGHSFRLAGVWLKSENLRFACAVTRFCSSRVKKKTLEIYDFQSSESYQGDIHSSSFFLFSTLAVPERLWQRRSHSLQQGSVVTPCPAVGPSVPFFVHVLFIFVEHRRRSPFFQVFPCSIHLLSTSNNGSIGSIPQTTSKMISLSLSKDILFVVDLGQLEPFVGIIFDTTDSMCNVCIFRNVKEVLVRTLIHPPTPHPHTPLMIIRQHVQHVKN